MKSGEWKYLHEWYDHYKPDVVISFVAETLKNLRAQRKKNSRHCGFVFAHTRLIPPKWVKGKTLKSIQKNAGPIRSATSGMDPVSLGPPEGGTQT